MTDFSRTRDAFYLPQGVTYLDGNSLGPLPVAAQQRMAAALQSEWGEMLIRGWNDAGWYEQPQHVGDRIGRLIGAGPGEVVMGDTLSIKVFQALSAALHLNDTRNVILTDSGNFPSDIYVAQGLAERLGAEVRIVSPDQLASSIRDDVAVLLVTEVDYRTGQRHDVAKLTQLAHDAGALVIWDLAHSAGAVDVDVTAGKADFAVGCTYKYLNGGPGSPAFIRIAPHLTATARPILQGWMGHDAPFAFDLSYRPAPGVERMRVGTPPVLALAVLEASLDIWDHVDMQALRKRSIELTSAFIQQVEATCPEVLLVTPREPDQRGSQVSFRHPQAYAIMQALIAQGVIGDFRAPDILRFGFAPLYNDLEDVSRAAAILTSVIKTKSWDRPEYHHRSKVT